MSLGERFARNLFAARRRAGLTQKQLAERAGMHGTEICIYEQGQRLPRLDTLMKLAGSLKAPAGELLDGIEWLPEQTRGKGVWIIRPGAR